MDRKGFLKSAFSLCGLSMIPIGVMEGCSQSTGTAPTNVNFTLDLTNSANAGLNAVGGAVVINSTIVICYAANTFYAYSAICTHQGCTVGYNPAVSTQIYCPCHGGTYSPATGAVTGGPPPSALTKFTVTRSGNILTVKS
jgi:cytochrome b6-f complex iron-sulfur subunit